MGENTKAVTHKNSSLQDSNIIDLTLSDDDNYIPSNNSIVKIKKHFKKRKLNIYNNEDNDNDKINDDIFKMYPQTQDFVFNELPEKRKNEFSIFKTKPPKKKRKEFKLSNLQVSIFNFEKNCIINSKIINFINAFYI